MVSNITFYGSGEATGGVADRKIETAKQETTGGVGVRRNNDSIFNINDEPKQDTVCFRGTGTQAIKKRSLGAIVTTLLADAALLVGLLGLAHKYDLVSKISNKKFQNFMRHSDVVTKPCHDACKWLKNNSYDRIVKFINTKK